MSCSESAKWAVSPLRAGPLTNPLELKPRASAGELLVNVEADMLHSHAATLISVHVAHLSSPSRAFPTRTPTRRQCDHGKPSNRKRKRNAQPQRAIWPILRFALSTMKRLESVRHLTGPGDALDLSGTSRAKEQPIEPRSSRQCASRPRASDTSPARTEDTNCIHPLAIPDFGAAIRAFERWSYNWGPEEIWEDRFREILCGATDDENDPGLVGLSTEIQEHVEQGWVLMDVLRELVVRGSGSRGVSVPSQFSPDVFDTMVALISKIRFLEPKDVEQCQKEAKEAQWIKLRKSLR
ncbi:hypothetical protein CONPUDRAFT_77439 [Coniophora puteana RWD-64-598 SS2]|uniref:Uncharacterized protein n=1 Tax=Coniophora puteana (strain RWD-64-598) TaxID=741705 RepID=A0A5M3M7F1_CONPW|nr:uncharacterized protein CONPUDRAFT_77439 [Coniophora puteana RWD-64-598 SS2]EIW75168.1 hypothetical protein CONPUDRAFT_77439 [Coniophora puteana RWD-64-598 SS2]